MIKKIFNLFILVYKYCISIFFFKKNCRNVPSCSVYAKIAIEKNNIFKAFYFIIKRIILCNPWKK